jgi:two-component system response regulator PhoP
MRVLLVEDETSIRESLAARLAETGYTVDSAEDGLEGLFLGREYAIDVGIVDIGLPKMSGIELIQELRKLDKNFPILILTARGNWQDKVEGLEAGADDYLVKPFHVDELLARLNALLRRSGGWSQPVLSGGPVSLDTRTQAVSINDQPVAKREVKGWTTLETSFVNIQPGETTIHLKIVKKNGEVAELYMRNIALDFL